MGFQPDPDVIRWRVHLEAPPERVWEFVTTDPGRESFWVERSHSEGYGIRLTFSDGRSTEERVLREDAPRRFAMTYFGSEVTFELDPDGTGVRDYIHVVDLAKAAAGWLNVLFPLKAAVDHGIDLRNHHPTRTWAAGFVDG